MYKHFFKRMIDFILSLLGLIILLPILLIVAFLVKVTSKGPILFKQKRIGKNGKVFNIYKFRSMCVGAEQQKGGVYSDKNDKRVTKIGKFIRATSIDELPQMLNILKGDMSFIGPRPPLTYHPWKYEEYTEEQKKMFEVRPGITGWAQVNGRKEVEWHKRIELNVWYVQHLSFLLDMKILFMTVGKVFTNANNENVGETVAKNSPEIKQIESKVNAPHLKLMYITNRPEIAKIAEKAGVDRIFVDLEYIGKELRQGGMDTVKSHHTIEDVKVIKNALSRAELLVRVNPIHDKTADYVSSEEEIEGVIVNGADIVMLPYFKTVEEVERFVKAVNGRCKTMLLIETPEAADNIEEILKVEGIDEYHIGINDLSIGYGKKFMFELVADGTVEKLCGAIKTTGKPYGFGGIAALGKGLVPAENVIIEHYRVGSSMAILSRSFCNTEKVKDTEEISEIFCEGVAQIREFENRVQKGEFSFDEKFAELKSQIEKVVNE